jgi:hypothetical protein
MLSSFVLSVIVIRTLGTPLGVSDFPPPNATPTVNPVESALPKNAPVTRSESADPKTRGLKFFRIRTYRKGVGGGAKLLTRIIRSRAAQPGSGSQNGNAPAQWSSVCATSDYEASGLGSIYIPEQHSRSAGARREFAAA